MKETTIRELSEDEISQVHGGIAPIIGLALSTAGHFMARTVGGSFLARASYAAGVYGAAEFIGD